MKAIKRLFGDKDATHEAVIRAESTRSDEELSEVIERGAKDARKDGCDVSGELNAR